ncbi:hypothetical protein L1987_29538 [Smallanthus sonchifolius]|uniref:Uncharacterized protein n=1 Tax=Smallanthus sonchifolius TaxID=185202 RepID=A0ACB9I133_9ASTR|nr:hypothetical protein L1987_29538 [Smallanthus sonchifolius]
MSEPSWRKRSMSAADITGDLPIYNPASAAGRREIQTWSSTSAIKYRLIHLIPLVVMLCFFILWCFSTPVDLETNDGRTTFVPRTKNKKSQQTSEAADLDLTVLALESPPDGFLLVSDGPYVSLGLANQPNVSFLDSHDHSASSTDSHVRNASLSVSHELFSISQEPSAPFSDLHEPNVSFTVSHDEKLLFPVSDEPRLSYVGKNNKAEQQASGEGS